MLSTRTMSLITTHALFWSDVVRVCDKVVFSGLTLEALGRCRVNGRGRMGASSEVGVRRQIIRGINFDTYPPDSESESLCGRWAAVLPFVTAPPVGLGSHETIAAENPCKKQLFHAVGPGPTATWPGTQRIYR